MLGNMLNDLAEAIRRWTEKRKDEDLQDSTLKLVIANKRTHGGSLFAGLTGQQMGVKSFGTCQSAAGEVGRPVQRKWRCGLFPLFRRQASGR